jgi:hypothetical protein
MEKHILKMTGEFFLATDCGPTSKTVKAMPLYEKLAIELGNECQVA